MRENFAEYKAGLERGQSYIIIYRSKPLARLEPIESNQKRSQSDIKKSIEMVEKLAGGIEGGKDLTPEKLNEFIDQSYDEVLP